MNDPAQSCPLCSEPVDDLLHALVHPDTEDPAHFECVLRAISEEEQLESGETVCYIGGGVFGIVCSDRGRRPVRIRKRIPYESETVVPQWRVRQVRQLSKP
jgi:hypothetical protein